MATLLKLQPNIPVEIALSCADGVNVVSPRGTPAVRYTLVDGRTFFATRYVAAKFKNMKVGPNEPITLCLRNIDGKSITVVERVPTTHAHAEPASREEASSAAPNNIPVESNTELAGSTALGVQSEHQMPDPEPDVATVPVGEGSTNGVASKMASKLVYELKLVENGAQAPSRRITKLEIALKNAVLAAYQAEKFGQKIGYGVRFDQESIKSMAVTLLIGMQGGRN